MLWKKSRLTIALNTDSSLTKGFSNFLYGPFWVLYYACANLSPFFQLYPEKFNPYPSHHIIGGYIFYFSVFLFSFFWCIFIFVIPGNRNIGFTTTYVVLTSNQINEFCFSLPRALFTSRSVVNNWVNLTLSLIETLIDNEPLNTLSTLSN